MTPAPFFSVIIPTYGRPKQLAACLHAFTHLAYPRDRFEVIVVDDGSPTSMEPVVAPVADALAVRLVRQPNAGPATARNTGAADATGPFLAFTDDDCRPAPRWLHAMADSLAPNPDRLVGGRSCNALPNNKYSTASQQLVTYLYAYYNARPEQARFFASNNMALAARRFHEVGGFDTRFPLAAGEDRDFCDRWRFAGFPMHYAPEAIIHHAHELTLRSFWRQHSHYGRGAYCFHRARAARGAQPITPEPLSFYLNLLRYSSTRSPKAHVLQHSLLLGLSQVANLWGFLRESFRQNRR